MDVPIDNTLASENVCNTLNLSLPLQLANKRTRRPYQRLPNHEKDVPRNVKKERFSVKISLSENYQLG